MPRIPMNVVAALALFCVAPLSGQTPEVEPNDAPETATHVELGAAAAGVVTRIDSQNHEQDWWSFDAAVGDTLRFEFDGAWVDLYAEDGITKLIDPREPVINYAVTKSGRYLLRVSTYQVGDQYYEIGLWTNRHHSPPCKVADDREPNGVPPSARIVAFSERVDGVFCPYEDTDYFRFHATRRTRVQIRIDRDSGSKPSAWGNPYVIVGSDRTDYHWNSDWSNGSVLEFWAPEDADYVAAVSTRLGTNIEYAFTVLNAGSLPTGPGEPTVTRATGLGSPVGLAVAPNGDIYTSDWDRHIWKITPAGQKSLFIADVQHSPNSLAFEPSGNLLVLSFGSLWRVSPSGEITPVVTTGGAGFIGDFSALTVAPDSTIWITTSYQLKHFDRNGQVLDSINVDRNTPYALGNLAFAPDGTLYFVSGDAIFRLVSGTPQLFIRDTTRADQPDAQPIRGFTFDAEGNLYATHPLSGSISRYDRNGVEIDKPYAWIPAAPLAIAFGRNADGSMNERLFVLANSKMRQDPSPPLDGTLFELHSNYVEPPARPQGITIPLAARELVRPNEILNAGQRAYLDSLGNNDGRYDVGDFRAFLQRETGVSASPR